MDVTKRSDVEAFVEAVVKHFGRLDVFVNNAGLAPLSSLAANKVDEWERMIDVNIKGVLFGIAAALPRFQGQKSGHLINVSSVAGHVVFPGGAVYCGTKFAVRAITEGFRHEAGPTIRSTTICPGAVKSELASTITNAGTLEALKPQPTLRSNPTLLPEPLPLPSSSRRTSMLTSSSCGRQHNRFENCKGVSPIRHILIRRWQ
jgi:NADP-dependent 3-hydroxy acid dehydrogenase YdfG